MFFFSAIRAFPKKTHTAYALLTQHFFPSDESNPRAKQIKHIDLLLKCTNIILVKNYEWKVSIEFGRLLSNLKEGRSFDLYTLDFGRNTI